MPNLDGIVQQLKQQRDRLDAAITALTSLNGSKSLQVNSGRTMSASARARISRAQKARWAAQRKSAPKTTGGAKRPKRRISAAGIARIRAAAKARWARVKRQKAA